MADINNHRCRSISRRDVLVVGSSGIIGATAGCLGDDETDDETTPTVDDDADNDAEDTPTTGDIQMGGELVTALVSGISSYDSVEIGDASTRSATGLIYERLTAIDFDLRPQPLLAEEIEWLDDTTVRVNCRQGVEFHNGDPFTAYDVEASLERSLGTTRDGFVSPWYESADIVDEHTVDLNTDGPFAPLQAEMLPEIQIVPEGAANGEVNLSEEPIGTGPYVFDEHEEGSFFRVRRNDDHWFQGNDDFPDLPPVETVTFRIIPELSTQESAIRTGELDLAPSVPAESLQDLRDADGVNVQQITGGTKLMLNYPAKVTPFNNQKVRRGTTRLVPREEINQVVFNGDATLGYSQVPPTMADFLTPEIEEEIRDQYVGRDEEAGRALIEEGLEEEGYEPPIETTIFSDNRDVRARQSEIIMNVLNDTGLFDIDRDLRDFTEFAQRYVEIDENGNRPQHDRNELVLVGSSGDPSPYESFNRTTTSDQTGGHRTGYHNDEVNRIMREEVERAFEIEDQIPLYQELIRILARDPPQAIIVWEPITDAVRDHVHGHEPFYDAAWQFTSIYSPYANSFVWLEQ